MHWLLIGYLFLFIDRPFEVWPWLGDLRIERIYMLFTMGAWLIAPKRMLPNGLHLAYVGFVFAVVACWAMSPWSDHGQPIVEDWLKIVVFYVLLVTTVFDEKGLKRLTVGFLTVMALYLLHSFREYLGGKHTYRMGIARMVGVDKTLGDPNSFGASIVFALPFVAAFWRAGIGGRLGKFALIGYTGLSVLCVLLTGSRSSLLGVILWGSILGMGLQKKWLYLLGVIVAAPMVFMALPESLQTRFETIVNPDVGPENAKESGEGRIIGLLNGLQLWASNPLTGVGPGAWRPATGSNIESHNLYGQLVGETGSLGAMMFLAILLGYWQNLRRIKKVRRDIPEWQNDLVFQIPSAVGTALILLLFMGNFGHNLFRFSWLWYGGFLIIARYCIERRLRELDEADWDTSADDDFDENADDFPPDAWHGQWERHSGHPSAHAFTNRIARW
ncbi:MAG: O-antigen ligase family protein [Bacteroidales bacterium]|nr:O-antigen ligase family protein [Bacteroidales bacterium]